ncbi:Phage head-tail joining protein [Pseudovibrio axinellae]|uniref:Phage head-tail joining protein n=1 Tax=Pseudovibrio axinellae TaxID=989403 RepID=A0A161XGK9_9HYPH|nr:phage head closure protein [Pseudovibrio axinellae]KZL20978.1 Phage head-tail joining protein [Pseudovibrio axinellae]SEP80460.1 phage head-tail adaptor, putative, SPP1 family [Pseudovibrio axinellae]
MKAAGTLNQPLLLLRPQTTNETDGSVIKSYQQVAMVWGQVQSSTGTEGAVAGRLASSYLLTLLMRRRTDIAEGWRVELDGQSLRVTAVVPAAPQTPLMQVLCELEEEGDGGT